MPNDLPQHKHSKDDIIIKDRDGKYKILREGKFVLLDEVESAELAAEHEKDHGPKRAFGEKKLAVPVRITPVKRQPEPKRAMPAVSGFIDKQLRPQAEDIIRKSGVTFASGEIRNRVVNILIPQIKGVRKAVDTKQSLLRAVPDGGAGLPGPEAERLVAALRGDAPAPLRPKIDVSLTQRPQSVMPSVQRPGGPVVGKEVSPPPKIAVKKPPVVQPLKPQALVEPVEGRRPPVIKPTIAPKPSLADIAPPKRPTVGLAGELAYTLADWRRVAPNPQDRSKKIENQLGVLEEDGFPSRLKGVSAWRNSQVFDLYLTAGKESLEKGQSLADNLGTGGPEKLSWDEWQAVAELNERIRV